MQALKELTIQKQPSYATTNPNRWTATAEYEGRGGSVSVLLDPAVTEPLLSLLAPIIAKFASKAAEEIAHELIEAGENVKAITAQATAQAETQSTEPQS